MDCERVYTWIARRIDAQPCGRKRGYECMMICRLRITTGVLPLLACKCERLQFVTHASWYLNDIASIRRQAQKSERGNKNDKKQKLLAGWMKDPKFENCFWTVAVSIGFKETVKQGKFWRSYKQLEDKYGEEEAREMINNKCLPSRRADG